jgi:hypothetical protein
MKSFNFYYRRKPTTPAYHKKQRAHPETLIPPNSQKVRKTFIDRLCYHSKTPHTQLPRQNTTSSFRNELNSPPNNQTRNQPTETNLGGMISEIMDVPLPRADSKALMSFLIFHISMFLSVSPPLSAISAS